MKKKEVKKLLKENPDFAIWVKKDPQRLSNIRNNPSDAMKLMARWKSETRKKINPFSIDFEALSDKSKRASAMLGSIQSVMEMVSEYSKNESRKL